MSLLYSDNFKQRNRHILYPYFRRSDSGWLPRPPPCGKRPPNGLTWAERDDGFFRVECRPRLGVMTIWSLSMLEEYGVDFDDDMNDIALAMAPEADPRLYLPFPWLRVPQGDISSPQNTWRSIQGINREGGVLPKLDAFDPDQPIEFGHVYEPEFKLEEFIPASYFPDFLIVNDPKGVTEGKRAENSEGCTDLEATPRKYKRVWPIMDPKVVPNEAERQNTAYLNFAGAPLLGTGHHSAVHRASLKLPLDLEANTSDGSIGVAAKIAFPCRGARKLLEHEAETYNDIYGQATNVSMDCIDEEGNVKPPTYTGEDGKKHKRHLMENWSGFCLPAPYIYYPVPVNAVVPKFFGYYVPTDEAEEAIKTRRVDGDSDDEYWRHESYGSEEDNKPDKTLSSPILLIEECGKPINPYKMTADDRTECLSFLVRLAFEDISHSSFFAGNIVVQPGPLTVAPSERSIKTPSYRVIDIGRAEHFATRVRREKAKYEASTGEELKEVKLPIGDDGYVRDDLPYFGVQAEWCRIVHRWGYDKDIELRRAKKELLFEDTYSPNVQGMLLRCLTGHV